MFHLLFLAGGRMIDLRPQFKHLHWRKMGHSMGVDVASDFADYPDDHAVFGLYKNCGLWTMIEANILYEWAKLAGGQALDIGCHTGWTSAHMAEAGCRVIAVDPMLSDASFAARFSENVQRYFTRGMIAFDGTSSAFFRAFLASAEPRRFSFVCIDGDHSVGMPLADAKTALAHLEERGVIILHDAIGKPVQDAVEFLVKEGFQCIVYPTPHVVAVCWRGEFQPPAWEYQQKVAASVEHHLAGTAIERFTAERAFA